MTLDEARAQIEAATDSARKQIELSNLSLTNNLDAADRIIMRKAADATIQLATETTDPT